jgi:aspartyl-tRNA(Asn)/glutamyl-tRNA(Gln) amidotransferase subunit C
VPYSQQKHAKNRPLTAANRHFAEGPAESPAALSGAAPSHLRARVIVSLTLQDIERIAWLARIEIDAREAADVHAKLTSIFAMIDALDAVDTSGIEPMSHAQDMTAPLRDDRVTESDRRAEFQRVAPATEDGLYLVPRVIE